MRILTAYDWPGNVRELENVLERMVVLSRGGPITELVLSRELLPTGQPVRDASAPPVPGSTFAEIERHAIMTTYEACGRSPQKTAAILGLSPRTIHYRLREYGGLVGRRSKVTGCIPCAPTLHAVR
jgi:DNA-binding NtrC family response regulator